MVLHVEATVAGLVSIGAYRGARHHDGIAMIGKLHVHIDTQDPHRSGGVSLLPDRLFGLVQCPVKGIVSVGDRTSGPVPDPCEDRDTADPEHHLNRLQAHRMKQQYLVER